ncbi:ammonium transporter [Actinophytocola sp.]|uniref:ammonium transporter n=1 Tax=Actinophytocola sp. TaxID=1872138 RepID=UPI003D6C5D39
MPFDFTAVNSGATAWILASAALVLLMTPGLAFFYGGMVRAKNVLGMLMQNLVVMALVSVLWMLIGYSLAFGGANGVLGGLHFAGLANLDEVVPGFTDEAAMSIPPVVYVAFQMMFAVITAALITGATADRWKFGSCVIVITLWTVVVYSPVAHWVFSPTGWLAGLGVLDWAGGTLVHVNAGAAALALSIVLGRRRGWPERAMPPHNLPFVVLGAALLWFGWFGFNAGSALNANALSGYAFVNTNTAAAAALLSWIAVEKLRYGKPTTLGAASGVVSGLVAVTPCAGFIGPIGAAVVGMLAGALCAFAVALKTWLRFDDSLDVAGVHLVAGMLGSLMVGLLATTSVNSAGADGLFYGGGYSLLGKQALAVLVVALYSFCATMGIGVLVGRLIGNRVSPRAEQAGLDLTVHGEAAYEAGVLANSNRPVAAVARPATGTDAVPQRPQPRTPSPAWPRQAPPQAPDQPNRGSPWNPADFDGNRR